jgi:hypothetical protein
LDQNVPTDPGAGDERVQIIWRAATGDDENYVYAIASIKVLKRSHRPTNGYS